MHWYYGFLFCISQSLIAYMWQFYVNAFLCAFWEGVSSQPFPLWFRGITVATHDSRTLCCSYNFAVHQLKLSASGCFALGKHEVRCHKPECWMSSCLAMFKEWMGLIFFFYLIFWPALHARVAKGITDGDSYFSNKYQSIISISSLIEFWRHGMFRKELLLKSPSGNVFTIE